MSASPFLTLAEVAAYMRYEDTPRALASCREWLRRREIRPSLKRGLFRKEIIDAAIEREEREIASARRRNSSLQPVSSRRVKRDRSLEGADVSAEDVGVRHAADSAAPYEARPCNPVAEHAP